MTAAAPPASTVRDLRAADLPALKEVIDATGLFPGEMLDAMVRPHLAGGADEIWLTAGDATPMAIAYGAPERMTEGCWNLLLIAVHPQSQGRGVGAALMREVERRLVRRDARLLLVETSGLPAFEATRRFYRGLGYGEEARIRDFYRPGEDKVVFRRALAEVRP